MGIVSTVLTRIGLPLALVAGIGFVLFTFRDQIGAAISGGAQVVGEAVSRPFSGFFQGLQSGFGGIPENINIPFPSFSFSFGEPQLQAPKAGSEPFMGGEIITPEGCFVDEKGRIDCPTPPIFIPPPPTNPPPPPSTPPPPLTEQEQFGGRFKEEFNVTGAGRLSFEELQRLGGEGGAIVGLFDVLGTQQTEFLPFTIAGVQASLAAGQRLRLSSQVFQDIRGIKNVEDLFI